MGNSDVTAMGTASETHQTKIHVAQAKTAEAAAEKPNKSALNPTKTKRVGPIHKTYELVLIPVTIQHEQACGRKRTDRI